MTIDVEQLRKDWTDTRRTALREKRPSVKSKKAAADLLAKVKKLGTNVADSKTRADLQDLAREVADHVFKTTGEYPSAVITPLVGESEFVPKFQSDISRILKYAPAQLIGREAETKLLNDAWLKVRRSEYPRPHLVTFVAIGGEGKTSLVAKWAAELAGQDWPGCDMAFAWSFYSQGTREQHAVSSDLFLKEALTFFGDDADKAFAASPAGAFEKGQRLARIVGRRRSLLLLDGLEPLQYTPTSPTPGQLKDQGIAALLKGLAASSHGLCVVTTRYSLPDLKAFWQTTAPEVKLLRLSSHSGMHLLKTLGVRGTAQEFATLVEDVKGHALTLTLLGGFLKRTFHGDIRQRDRVKFEKADEKMDGGHAFRTMSAYEQWLLSGGDEGRREIAVLRLMGLFDRPADAGCLAALRSETIPGLTEPLAGLADEDWEFCLSGLEAAKLLTVNRDASSALVSLDAHPLVRHYFATQLREKFPAAWRAAHRRLYEHLCATAPDKPQPTLEDLQPLYQAVSHGCQAGLQREACDDVYRDRILRCTGRHAILSTKKVGVIGADLGAVACFFDQPWSRVSPLLTEADQAWLLNQAAFRLRAVGRLAEALDPMRTGAEMAVKQEDWKNAAVYAGNLSELNLTFGEVDAAVRDAEASVTHADRSADEVQRLVRRTTHADALHQAGQRVKAEARFREAEEMQAQREPDYPLLYSLQGCRYCDLLLREAESASWQIILQLETLNLKLETAAASCRAISKRAAQTLQWTQAHSGAPVLDIALGHLTLARAALYAAILSSGSRRKQLHSAPRTLGAKSRSGGQAYLAPAASEVDLAVSSLQRSGAHHHIPRGFFTRAWLRFLTGARTGSESAQSDLDEAWEIAERGPMKLFLADIHLHRARLFFREKSYPWESPAADLAAAEKLINACGYHRRDEELADASRAILG